MKNLYFTYNNKLLFSSFNRYLKFIFNSGIQSIDLLQVDLNVVHKIFVLQEEKENPEFLKLIEILPITKFIVIDYNGDSNLNLLDQFRLYTRTQEILKPDYIPIVPLFTQTELILKVKNFFKGHGEKSLFSGLDWARYFLSNGPILYNQNEITHDEFTKNFLSPGISYWINFCERFNRYNIYLKLLKYKNEVEAIKSLILKFNNFIPKLNELSLPDVKSELTKYSSENIGILSKIDEILTTISRDLNIGEFPVQNFSSR